MTDVDRLLREYIREHQAGGEADPLAYVERLEGAERAELEALIDGYLARAPGQAWDPEAYRGSPAEQVVTALTESLAGVSGSWPMLLPELRNRARIRRDELVAGLAEKLGVGGREEKVAYYYNQMEHGLLEPSGVSDRVLDALAGVVDTTREALRGAGERVAPPDAGEGAVFARKAYADADHGGEAPPAPAGAAAPARDEGIERDEVDDLFLGG